MASALGLCQLAKLDHILAERRRKAKRYDQALAASELVAAPWLRGPEDSNYQVYSVSPDRDGVIAELATAGPPRGSTTGRSTASSSQGGR